MTYTELYEERWNGKTKEAPFLKKLDNGSQKAWLVIKVLDSRGGFDHWWDDIDSECKDEIFEELRAVLAEPNDKNQTPPPMA